MKLNIQNLTNQHKRVCFVPSPDGTANLPNPLTNPTLGFDDDRLFLCVSPRPNITCVGASSTALFQLYIGADNANTAFRLRATVNGQSATLNIGNDLDWVNYFAFNANMQLIIQDVRFMVYPFRSSTGTYSYYIRMMCMGTGEKRVELTAENLQPNTNIKLPFINGNDLGIEGEELNPTMLVVGDNKAHACLIPMKEISCAGAIDQSGCIDFGDVQYDLKINDVMVSTNVTAEQLLQIGTFNGIQVEECHELSRVNLQALKLITPDMQPLTMPVSPYTPNISRMATFRIYSYDAEIPPSQLGFGQCNVAVDNVPYSGEGIYADFAYPTPLPTDGNPTFKQTGHISISGESYYLQYELWGVKSGDLYGWEVRIGFPSGVEIGVTHDIYLYSANAEALNWDNLTYLPGIVVPGPMNSKTLKITVTGAED